MLISSGRKGYSSTLSLNILNESLLKSDENTAHKGNDDLKGKDMFNIYALIVNVLYRLNLSFR